MSKREILSECVRERIQTRSEEHGLDPADVKAVVEMTKVIQLLEQIAKGEKKPKR